MEMSRVVDVSGDGNAPESLKGSLGSIGKLTGEEGPGCRRFAFKGIWTCNTGNTL